MQSNRFNAENPWNLFISNEVASPNETRYPENKSESCRLETFLSSSLPLRFMRNQNVMFCNLCKVLITKSRFKQHYVDRHSSICSKSVDLTFEDETERKKEEEIFTEHRTEKIKKVKRNRKKRTKIKDKIEYLEKKKSKEIKDRTTSKRLHSKSFVDSGNYLQKPKKIKLVDGEVIVDKINYLLADEGIISSSSSPRPPEDLFYSDNMITTTKRALSSFEMMCCSNSSVHKTCSDSSTPPPSLSLGNLHTTLSSPSSSLNVLLNEQHYFLASSERKRKHHIDSLPWENFSWQLSQEDGGEVERAVQSITNLFDAPPQIYRSNNVDNEDENFQEKLDIFNADEASMIDCFLDEVLGVTKPPPVMLMEDCNSLSEYHQADCNPNSLGSDIYEDRLESLINDAVSDFVQQSPQNISIVNDSVDLKKASDDFDALRHCGVVLPGGLRCHRSLLCKLHTMPQKRQVPRPESLSSLVKDIRQGNKTKRLRKKQALAPENLESSHSSKASCDSFNYICSSSTRSLEEAGSFLENGLSTPDLDLAFQQAFRTSDFETPGMLVNVSTPQDTLSFQHGSPRTLVAMKSLLWRSRPKPSWLRQKHDLVQENQLLSTVAHDLDAVPAILVPAHKSTSIQNSIVFSQERCLQQGHSIMYEGGNPSQIKSVPTITHARNNHMYNSNVIAADSSRLPSNATPVSDLILSSKSMNLCSSSNGFFSTNCNNQLLNINAHFVAPTDSSPSLKETTFFAAPNNGSILSGNGKSSNTNFIPILDEGGSSYSTVGNAGKLMMVMGKNNGLLSGQHNLASTPHIVAVSPGNFHNCFNASTDNTNNPIIYQLNQPAQSQSSSSSVAQPLTVQSSTQRFVILPDGTISAFTQQMQPNYGQGGQTYLFNGQSGVVLPQTANNHRESTQTLTLLHPQHQIKSKPPQTQKVSFQYGHLPGAVFLAATPQQQQQQVFVGRDISLLDHSGDFDSVSHNSSSLGTTNPSVGQVDLEVLNQHQQQQHIIVNSNSSNEHLFAQSQLKLPQHHQQHRLMSTAPFVVHTPSSCPSLLPGNGYQSVPPPLVVSQQLLGQAASHQLSRKKQMIPEDGLLYQQTTKANQLVMDGSQFTNEYTIVQSMIA